ncbi:MAG: hypothetical protein EXS59_01935 [Candidatus Taylorbacteria bacterium]|nr:hypothetical protein [Candidatus Taylorbacteria bacterium]
MEKDKRPLYILLAVILAHIGVYLYVVLQEAHVGSDLVPTFFPVIEFLWVAGIAFVVSVGALLTAIAWQYGTSFGSKLNTSSSDSRKIRS